MTGRAEPGVFEAATSAFTAPQTDRARATARVAVVPIVRKILATDARAAGFAVCAAAVFSAGATKRSGGAASLRIVFGIPAAARCRAGTAGEGALAALFIPVAA